MGSHTQAYNSWSHAIGLGHQGVRLHYVRQGHGDPVLLLHGWPGFWYDWHRVIPGLASLADVIAPDLRGFGDSDKPDLPPSSGYTPEVHADDLASLIDHLGLAPVVVVAHDIGATIAQTLARRFPHHVRALVLLNPPYPGIGSRRFEPQAQREFWYQHLHQLPLAEELVGHSRETVGAYLRYFYRYWTGRQDMVSDEELAIIVDAYARPGAFAASLAYYRARAGAKDEKAAGIPLERIVQPTSVLWGESDPVIPVSWSDRLGDTFADFTLRTLPGVGHFVPWEAPDDVIDAVSSVLDLCATPSDGDRCIAAGP
jgi:pimeloyl-ACP methyl ester carboxylesterase